MKSASVSLIATLLGAASAAELPVGCTEEATAAGITLRGNADDGASWTELYKEPVDADESEASGPRLRGAPAGDTDEQGWPRGAMFDLAFEMRCDAPRTFDLGVSDGAGTEVYSFADMELDHTFDKDAGRASFATGPFWLEEGLYEFCLTSKVVGIEESRVCGYLNSVMDKDPPMFAATIITPGTAVAPGATVAFNFAVMDDAALDHLHVQKNGETYEWLTLAFGEDFMMGVPQSVRVVYEVPAEENGEQDFNFELCDQVGNCVEETEKIQIIQDQEQEEVVSTS